MTAEPVPLIDHPKYLQDAQSSRSLGDRFLDVLKEAVKESDEAKSKVGSSEMTGWVPLTIIARRMNISLAEAEECAGELSNLGFLALKPHAMRFMREASLENILFAAPVDRAS